MPAQTGSAVTDYYAIYGLDRTKKASEIKKELRLIQGDIREKMNYGSHISPAAMTMLQQSFAQVAAALKVFRTEESKRNYDKALSQAIGAGAVSSTAQAAPKNQNLAAEMEQLFLKGNYHSAIQKGTAALQNNIQEAKVYCTLAKCYKETNEIDQGIQILKNGLKVHPDHMEILGLAARFYSEGKQDYAMSQKLVNRMLKAAPEDTDANIEQAFLYLCSGKRDLAYQQMEDFIYRHPTDRKFRKKCAYDLLGFSYQCYTRDPQTGASVIASEEDYLTCLEVCNKAASIYRDSTVEDCLSNAKHFGEVEFNEDNRENIRWSVLAGVIYLIPGIGGLAVLLGEAAEEGLAATLAGAGYAMIPIAIGLLVLYAALNLRKVSWRPYWQIYKYQITGQREKKEKRYILIGNILTGYMKWSIRGAIAMMKFVIALGSS